MNPSKLFIYLGVVVSTIFLDVIFTFFLLFIPVIISYIPPHIDLLSGDFVIPTIIIVLIARFLFIKLVGSDIRSKYQVNKSDAVLVSVLIAVAESIILFALPTMSEVFKGSNLSLIVLGFGLVTFGSVFYAMSQKVLQTTGYATVRFESSKLFKLLAYSVIAQIALSLIKLWLS